jgi:hypothetical protein
MLLSAAKGNGAMTREELDKKIELEQARNRAAIEKADAFLRWFDREAPIHEARTERVFRELREEARRGRRPSR